jgi:hypothetical protein
MATGGDYVKLDVTRVGTMCHPNKLMTASLPKRTYIHAWLHGQSMW